MFKFILFLFMPLISLVLIPNLYAADETIGFSSDMTYSHDTRKQYEKFPEAVDKAISHFAFNKLTGTGLSLAVNSLDLMDRIYIPQKYGESPDQRLILAKSGFETTGAVKYGEIYDTSSGYIIHFKTKDSGDVALFFRGFSLEKVQKIKNEVSGLLNSKSQAHGPFSFESEAFVAEKKNPFQMLFLPWAQAEESSASSGSLCKNSFGASADKVLDATGLTSYWNCLKSFHEGAWDSSVGMVSSAAQGAFHLIKDPAGTFKEAADDFSKLGGLLADIEGVFGELKPALQALPQDVKVKIACEITGSVGQATLITFVTLAAGSPLLYRAIVQALEKVLSALPAGTPVAATVAKLVAGMGAKAEAAQKNLELIKKIKDAKGFSKEIQAEMDALRDYLKKGRDPLKLVDNGPDRLPTLENGATKLHDLKAELDPNMSDIERSKKINTLNKALAKQDEDYEAAKRKFSKLKVLQRETDAFLKSVNPKSTTPAQKAAIGAYFAQRTCSTISSTAAMVKSSTSAQEQGKSGGKQ